MAVILGLILGLGVFSGQDVIEYAHLNPEARGDAAVVLGAAVYSDRPSPVFRERINHAINLYFQGQVEAIIFTGGVGKGDQLAESEAARNYALAAGVPSEAIWIETVSINTNQNLQQAQIIAGRQDFKTLVLISDPLHMGRVMELSYNLGLDAVSSPTPTSRYQSWGTKTSFLLREIYFLSLLRVSPN
jgi:uncharacterized SAM-binding protein YcdF (DUF218 family)